MDGVVWERGAIDMLNLTSTMAVATRQLAASGTLIYLAVADEEAGGFLGAGHLAEHEALAVKCDYVITESGGVPRVALAAHPVHGVPDHVPRPQRARGHGQPQAVGDDVGGTLPRVPRLATPALG